MDYKLAKKLKDSGFPQFPSEKKVRMSKLHAPGFYLSEGGEPAIHNKNLCYIPTLSELIEACGDVIFALGHVVDEKDKKLSWKATAFSEVSEYIGLGKTPEEAVANLWLALQAKK